MHFLHLNHCLSICLSVTRLEERESDMKKEYNALHQRHTEVRENAPPQQTFILSSQIHQTHMPVVIKVML